MHPLINDLPSPCSAPAGMGRSKHLLKDRNIKIRLPGHPKPACHPVSAFWVQGKNAQDLDTLPASHTGQCHFRKICGIHTALMAPKSLLHNFTKLKSTSLDCKPCQAYNSSKRATPANNYETAAYTAVAALPDDFGIAETDMLVDHRLLGLTGSSVDIYLPRIKLCIMVDGEGHFREHRETTAETQASIDDRFNHEATAKGYRVLRMHYKDSRLFNRIVRIAAQRCLSGVYGAIDFSKEYGDEVRRIWKLSTLN